MTSALLYGILVTERSYRMGMRSLATQHQGNYLAHKVIGDRLPTELCDEIGAELSTLLEKDAAQVWKEMKHDPEARTVKFHFEKATTMESERIGRSKYDLVSTCETAEGTVKVYAVLVRIEPLGAAEGQGQRYMHLSATLVRPSIATLVPNLANHSGGPPLLLANGKISVNISPNSARPSMETFAVSLRAGEPVGATMLIQFDDVEASIRTWNRDLIESLVSRLGLLTVDVSGVEGIRGGMKPELRILQRLEW
ncbi:hypothetical protein Q7P36_010499 [Cladosporium allicinum]